MLVINELDDRWPRVTVIDVVPKTRCINDSKLDLKLFLFELGLDNLHFCQLVKLFVVAAVVVFGRGKLSWKECVDEGGLSKSGLA
jgi:hypothetical protein